MGGAWEVGQRRLMLLAVGRKSLWCAKGGPSSQNAVRPAQTGTHQEVALAPKIIRYARRMHGATIRRTNGPTQRVRALVQSLPHQVASVHRRILSVTRINGATRRIKSATQQSVQGSAPRTRPKHLFQSRQLQPLVARAHQPSLSASARTNGATNHRRAQSIRKHVLRSALHPQLAPVPKSQAKPAGGVEVRWPRLGIVVQRNHSPKMRPRRCSISTTSSGAQSAHHLCNGVQPCNVKPRKLRIKSGRFHIQVLTA